ncbi:MULTISPECIES: helix-turn-helix domain-containing protein [Bradyrhizobium]|uniref:helix-turn-helix domain-containing protein n=1 Tax=Bradyrhizobium pachyrhizi TaxID=280333 RepID=UPI002AA5DB2A
MRDVEVSLLGGLQHVIVDIPLAAYPGEHVAEAKRIPSERASDIAAMARVMRPLPQRDRSSRTTDVRSQSSPSWPTPSPAPSRNSFEPATHCRNSEFWRERRKFRKGSTAARALDEFHHYPVVTAKRLAELLEISPPQAHQAINQLEDARILKKQTGYARNRVYIASEALSLINRPFGEEPILPEQFDPREISDRKIPIDRE